MNVLKIVVVGNPNVGKTSIIRRYTDDTFTDNKAELRTIGVEFCKKAIVLHGIPYLI